MEFICIRRTQTGLVVQRVFLAFPFIPVYVVNWFQTHLALFQTDRLESEADGCGGQTDQPISAWSTYWRCDWLMNYFTDFDLRLCRLTNFAFFPFPIERFTDRSIETQRLVDKTANSRQDTASSPRTRTRQPRYTSQPTNDLTGTPSFIYSCSCAVVKHIHPTEYWY